jgi:hypothetical protein
MAAITDIENVPGKSNWYLSAAIYYIYAQSKILRFMGTEKEAIPATKVAPVAKQA